MKTFVLLLLNIAFVSHVVALGNSLSCSESIHTTGFRSVAYFVNWGIYDRNYEPMDLPVDKLTHVLYAFANITGNGEVGLTDSWSDTEKRFPGDSQSDTSDNVYGCVKQLFLHKKKNRNLKVLLSILSPNYAQSASSEAGRLRFAESATRLMLNLGFDGLDIDWEFPKDDVEATNFVTLLQTIRKALDDAAGPDRRFQLTAAVSAGNHFRNLRLSEMTPYLDFFNLMAYDYTGKWSTIAGHQANLNFSVSNPQATPFSSFAALNYYIHTGKVPTSKIVLGMPLYGRAFNGTDGPGTPYQELGSGGWENGVWDYKALPRPGAVEKIDLLSTGGAGASWSYDPREREMVSYDTVSVIEEKTDFIVNYGLGGGMWWEASGDKNGTSADGSLIATFADGIIGQGRGLERINNVLKYPESKYDNLKAGFPQE